LGHAAGVYLAHVEAMTSFKSYSSAMRTQYIFAVLMVAFTVASLSIIAAPLVEDAPDGVADGSAGPVLIAVPADAVVPQPGTGELRPVASGAVAQLKLVYRPMPSAFHDGSTMATADILYALAFAYRWGAAGEGSLKASDPAIARATQRLRDRLVGLRLAGVDAVSRSIRFSSELHLVREMPIIEIYLRGSGEDDETVAPPWTVAPWHAIALMEEVVTEGGAAFSAEQANRSESAWLDVVRSAPLKARMASILEQFARSGYIPRRFASS